MNRQDQLFLCFLLIVAVVVLLNSDLGWGADKAKPAQLDKKLSVNHALLAYPAQDPYYKEEEAEEGLQPEPRPTQEGRRRQALYAHPELAIEPENPLLAVDECPTPSGVGCLKGPVVLLHQGRCGSSVLLDMLGWRVQDIRLLNDGELFFPADPTPEVFRYLEPWPPSKDLTNSQLYEDGHKATEEEMAFHVEQLKSILKRNELQLMKGGYGFPILSLKLYQIENAKMRMDDYLWALAEAGIKHLVVLHRSYLRVYVSSKMARETGRFSNSDAAKQVHCPEVPFEDDWVYRANVWRRLDKEYSMALTHPAFPNRLTLSYETDIYEDPRVAARMVNTFLGREVDEVPLQMYRTSDCPLPEAIADFDALSGVLRGTSLEYMLEPEGGQVPLPQVEVTV
eukprot:CAMPEP_0114614382 /NCGR_PEP_ID=MMETSP0168-20121206/5626_1 /TAXON_ID=95228 ORGANISM="Vannella sp., Strain DIVA3 517/6/12" /NCGR_SAMPLE_ID=MMETSP0168 /ASSEMBLY_ACC=CAM_ASM_000044 /LENGTH=395 /DNA_ID=CAMNT_0001825431 /DNA_START=111 /DNA_END=1294 /DNA_ORIENTATION=+